MEQLPLRSRNHDGIRERLAADRIICGTERLLKLILGEYVLVHGLCLFAKTKTTNSAAMSMSASRAVSLLIRTWRGASG
jgi:hypothetical protein